MDYFKINKLEEMDSPPPINFSFTDSFIQSFYKLQYSEIELILKITLFMGSYVEITAANIWQSELSAKLINNASILFKGNSNDNIIKLSTRLYSHKNNIFTKYFDERLNEKSHFISIPGELTLLDFQLPETKDIARQLDDFVSPSMRKGGNVTEIYTNLVTNYMNRNQLIKNGKIEEYKVLNSVSRLTVADCILSQPLSKQMQETSIINSNVLYFYANGIATKSQVICPIGGNREDKNFGIYYEKGFSLTNREIVSLLAEIGLFPVYLKQLHFDTFLEAYKLGIVQNIRKYFWYKRLSETEKIDNNLNFFLKNECIRNVELIKKMIQKQIIANKSPEILKTQYKDFNSNKKIFTFKLDRKIYFDEENKMTTENINIGKLMEECNSKLNFTELKTIAVEIFGDHEMIGSANKLEFIRELCMECQKKEKLYDLIKKAMKKNQTFRITSLGIDPLTIFDWKADTLEGESISKSEYEKVISTYQRFQSVGFLEKGFNISKRICMLSHSSFMATCFMVNENYILTNKHALDTNSIADETELLLNYEEGTSRCIPLHKRKLIGESLVVSEKYDIAICKIEEKSLPEYFDEFPTVKYGAPQKDDIVPIIQHPNGFKKQICIGHNSLKFFNNEIIQYTTDTMPGSSGSPVFDSNWNLIGLHSRGGNIAEPSTGKTVFRNEGIHIDIIKKFLEDNKIELK